MAPKPVPSSSSRINDGGLERTQLWTTIVTTDNSQNTIVLSPPGTNDIVCGGVVYTGVDTLNPFAEATGAVGKADTNSINLTVDAGDAIIGISVDDLAGEDTYSGTGTWNRFGSHTGSGPDKISGSLAEQVFASSGQKDQDVDFNSNTPDFARTTKHQTGH